MIALTPDVKAALKAAFPDVPLYKIAVLGQDYVIRPLTRAEYLKITAHIAAQKAPGATGWADKLVETCQLFPPQDDRALPAQVAGIRPTLAARIEEKSLLTLDASQMEEVAPAEVIVERAVAEHPSEEEIARVKKLTDLSVHLVKVLGAYYFVRPIRRLEWVNLQKLPEETDLQMALVERCLLHPKKPDWNEAGAVTVLYKHILDMSGFTETAEVEEL